MSEATVATPGASQAHKQNLPEATLLFIVLFGIPVVAVFLGLGAFSWSDGESFFAPAREVQSLVMNGWRSAAQSYECSLNGKEISSQSFQIWRALIIGTYALTPVTIAISAVCATRGYLKKGWAGADGYMAAAIAICFLGTMFMCFPLMLVGSRVHSECYM